MNYFKQTDRGTVIEECLEDKLKQYFGYNDFRLHQKEIIQAVLQNQDVVAILPTGAGKSLCYQLPAMIMPGTAIVISPLISLMQDQVNFLFKSGIPAAFLNSSLYSQDIQSVLANLADYKLLYVAPERLVDEQFLAKLKEIPISFFVVDEAHCISQWGHSFRVEYRKLTILKQFFPHCPIMALTATATQDVQNDMITQLAMEKPVVLKGSFDRPNLTVRIQLKNNLEQQLTEFLNQQKGQSGILYCSTRKGVETYFELLKEWGWSVRRYHGGLTDRERAESQHAFLHDEVPLMVATMAFGMGVHKPDIRFIVHLDMPRTIEQYYQEIGRAGRDGLPAECLMFYSPKEFFVYKSFDEKESDPLIREQMAHKTSKMYFLCKSLACRRKELLKYFGESYSNAVCQSCDNCLDEDEKIDGTIIAQKIISCVYRLDQRFGVRTVMEVLRGSKSQNVLHKGHDKLSTYGILKDISEKELRYYIDSLIQMDVLKVTEGEYPVLRCLPKALEIVQGRSSISFKKISFGAVKERQKVIEKPQTTLNYHVDLYEELKQLRLNCAKEEQVPPFVIFSDRSLQEMAVYFPQTQQEFSQINGVGPIKWLKYGEKFLNVIKSYGMQSKPREQVKSPIERLDSVAETVRLYRENPDIERIMETRLLARSTIITHLAEALQKGIQLDLTPLITPQKAEAIRAVITEVGYTRLAPIKAALPPEFNYDEIRLIAAEYAAKNAF